MLENIEIIDYKCFKNLKLDGLSQINVISGGNNVGKTALLEAIYLMNNSMDISYFYKTIKDIYQNRELHIDTLDKYFNGLDLSFKVNGKDINIKHWTLNKLKKQDIGITLDNSYNNFIVSTTDTKTSLIPFHDSVSKIINRYIKNNNIYINSSKPISKELVKLYSTIQELGLQQKFLSYLQILDSNITWIEPQLANDELYLRINLKNPEMSLFSSELGEGTNRFIEILASLLQNTDVVLIDEIENGIHYSKLKDIWKAIIEIVQKEKIQLFVTTHDEDTIKALVEASEEMEYKDVTSIQLVKDEENKIIPIVRKFDNFAYGINRGADVR